MREKPLRFLRYFILSRYDVELLREDEIYGWFTRNEKQCGYSSDPVAFVQELLTAARAYRSFLNGSDQHGANNRYLQNLQILGGRAARQHLILLLAGSRLPAHLFDRLAKEVEDLFFVYVVTREPTRNFERNFAKWASELRRVKDEKSFNSFVSKTIEPNKAELAGRFDDAMRRMYYSSVQLYRLRYILAKLTQYVELSAYGESEGTKWLSRFVGSDFHIEHIYPERPSAAAKEEFEPSDDFTVAYRLGNLALVETSINTSLGNKPFSEKRKIYPQSQLLLTAAYQSNFRTPKDWSEYENRSSSRRIGFV
jgi:hypothetical protein